jgi:hypothetical protein
MIASASKLLVAAAAVACGAALAQPTQELVPIDSEQDLFKQIDELRAKQGRNAEGLVDPLRALAFEYQETGDHAQAVVALQEARQIIRANRGLFSATVDEALVLQQQIRSEKELGNGEQVWNLQYDLINIARQHLDDVRMLPVFLELIDDRTQRFEEFSTTNFRELPPGLYVPCEPGAVAPGVPVPVLDSRACPFGTWAGTVDRLRGAVLRNYADAIAVLIRSGNFASQELRNLEKQALSLVPSQRRFGCSVENFAKFLESELVDTCLDPAGPLGGGGGGGHSLMRLVYYEVRSGAPATARARAYAELGDWYLRADHLAIRSKASPADELALRLYEEALAALRQDAAAPESIAEIFLPELPIMLPTHAPNPLATMESPRFIDIAFTITKYGESGEIVILDSSEDATRAEKKGLMRLIEFGSFRPRAVDGELADSAPVVVRYYLPETPLSAP